jgi:TPR repeat protein
MRTHVPALQRSAVVRTAALAAVAVLAAAPLAAEGMHEWNQTQSDRALVKLQNSPYDGSNRSSSSSSSGSSGGPYVSEAEQEAQRLEEQRLWTEHVKAYEAKLKADREAKERERRESFDRQLEADRRERESERDRQRKQQQTLAWKSSCRMALSALGRSEVGSPEAATAVHQLELEAEDGSPDAIGAYGWILIEGFHVPEDAAKGRAMLRRSIALDGDRIAMVRYAKCLAEGVGGECDELAARGWYRAVVACSAPGYGVACYELGVMDELGRGSKRDLHAAVKWFRTGASMGYLRSRLHYAEMQQAGVGMPKDPEAAKATFTELAECDDPDIASAARTAIIRIDR